MKNSKRLEDKNFWKNHRLNAEAAVIATYDDGNAIKVKIPFRLNILLNSFHSTDTTSIPVQLLLFSLHFNPATNCVL